MKDNWKTGTIVDVRTEEEFLASHYPDARNILLIDVPVRIKEFSEMKKPIVVYCKSGDRSSILVSLLQQIGIGETINAGGLENLKKMAEVNG